MYKCYATGVSSIVFFIVADNYYLKVFLLTLRFFGVDCTIGQYFEEKKISANTAYYTLYH